MRSLLVSALLAALTGCAAAPAGAGASSSAPPPAPPASSVAPGAPPIAAPTASAELAGPRTAMGPAEIRAALEREHARFRECFEDTLGRGSHPSARVVVRFTIGADGAVSDAEKVEDAFAREELVRCVVEAVRGVLFPPPASPPLQVVYPFTW